MYASENFLTKKAFKEALKAGKVVTPNPQGLERHVENGRVVLEGPWYPKPHTWYAQGLVKDGRIVSVK